MVSLRNEDQFTQVTLKTVEQDELVNGGQSQNEVVNTNSDSEVNH